MIDRFLYDFLYSDKLDYILQHPKLQDKKYGSPNYKEVAISNYGEPFWASAMFLKSLREKFGNISFRRALKAWREEQHKRSRWVVYRLG